MELLISRKPDISVLIVFLDEWLRDLPLFDRRNGSRSPYEGETLAGGPKVIIENEQL